jgi:hypothetical protein
MADAGTIVIFGQAFDYFGGGPLTGEASYIVYR